MSLCSLCAFLFFFFFNDTATTEIYTLSLHDALPISRQRFSAYEIGVVLAQDGWRFGGPPAGAAIGERRSRQPDLAERRVLYHVDQAEVVYLRRGVDLVQRPHPSRGHSRLVQAAYPLVHARGRERRGHHFFELFNPGYAVAVAGEALVVRIEPDQRGKPPPEPLGANGDVDLSVRALVGPVRRYGRVSVAVRLGHLAGYEPARSLEGMYAYDAPQKRGRHPLASAAPLPLHQGRGDAEGPEHTGEDVRDGHPDLRRGTAQGTGEAHQAPFTLHDLVETRPMTVRTSLPEARDRERHQPRIQFLEFSLRLIERKYVDSPFTNGGPQPRLSSPFPGRSTFITSAPASASIMVA